jgi:histidinol-phosphatase (PHP family)
LPFCPDLRLAGKTGSEANVMSGGAWRRRFSGRGTAPENEQEGNMYDYHTHSFFSGDSKTPLEEMVARAVSLGLVEYAVTDHFDPDYPDYPFTLSFPEYHAELIRLEALYREKIRLVKGIEVGIQHGDTLKKCSAAVNAFPYDFVLGSFHCAEGFDICRKDFFAGRSLEDAYIVFYSYMLDCLKKFKDYDVLSHFNVIDRYVDRIPDDEVYMDIVEKIIDILVADGKGIEINTSSFRYGMGERTLPSAAILARYVKMGGEIITTGSDAHRAKDVGYMLDHAREMIKAAGLNRIASFKNREVRFVAL